MRPSCDAETSRENDLVRSLALVTNRQLGRIAEILQVTKAHTLHDAAAVHVETDDYTTPEHSSSFWMERRTPPLVLNTVPPSCMASRSARPNAFMQASMM